MSIRELHTKAVIKNEPGIISKKGGGFHMPASFAEKHLFYGEMNMSVVKITL